MLVSRIKMTKHTHNYINLILLLPYCFLSISLTRRLPSKQMINMLFYCFLARKIKTKKSSGNKRGSTRLPVAAATINNNNNAFIKMTK